MTAILRFLFVSYLAIFSTVAAATASHTGLAGEPTQILVLGTPHLTGSETLAPEDLEPLLEKLEGFAPDIIAIEAVPGQSCELLRIHAQVFPGVAETYCLDPQPAREVLQLSAGAAALELAIALDGIADNPNALEMRRLASLFLANGDRWSAALHWSYLSDAERIPQEGMSFELVNELDKTLSSQNENWQIAGVVARRLGLQRLYQMDDHTADSVMIFANPALPQILQDIWSQDIGEEAELEAHAEALLQSNGDVLAHYRFINSPRYQEMVDSADFGAAAVREESGNAGREYLAWWHTRNLRMASNIIAAAGNSPGARVLVLTGTSHKAYLDRILGQFLDVVIVDVDEVLAD